MPLSTDRIDQHHSELLLQKLIDNAYDGIYVTDRTGRPLYYNSAFLRLSGLTADEVKTLSVWELLERNRIPNSCVAEVLKKNRPYSTIIRYYSGVEAIVTGTPVCDEDGALLYVVANVRDITELTRLRRELEAVRTRLDTGAQLSIQIQGDPKTETIVYRSAVMEKVLAFATRVATVDSPVLILGESGVGKDVLAKYIHTHEEKGHTKPFIKVNCGAIPPDLLESELFGYEGGAFTGANRNGKPGMFELANGGTIFLDEIGEMPLALQVKLLAVLQDQRVQRLGSTRSIPLQVRVIAATNANLIELLEKKKFREDLFYRLNVLSVTIPPLRERPEDIPALIAFFLQMFNRKFNLNRYLAPETVQALLEYSWPGNVRQLKNLMERLVVLSEDDRIGPEALSTDMLRLHPSGRSVVPSPSNGTSPGEVLPLREAVARFERAYLEEQLRRHRTLRRCADALGVDVATLVRKKKRYGL